MTSKRMKESPCHLLLVQVWSVVKPLWAGREAAAGQGLSFIHNPLYGVQAQWSGPKRSHALDLPLDIVLSVT